MRGRLFIDGVLYSAPSDLKSLQVSLSFITGYPTDQQINKQLTFELDQKMTAIYKGKVLTYEHHKDLA